MSRYQHALQGLMVAVSLLGPVDGRAAWAQKRPGPNASLASEAAARGQRLYQQKRYAEAVTEFEKAYELEGVDSYLYNVAQSHRLAGHTDQALAAYELYLTRVPAAPNRADIERRMEELRRGGSPPVSPAPAPVVPPAESPTAPPAGGWTAPPPSATTAPPGWSGAGTVMPPPAVVAPSVVGARLHDGVYLRLQLGWGAFNASRETAASQQVSISGWGSGVTLALGKAVRENLILFGQIGSFGVSDPKVEVAKVGGPQSGTTDVFGLGVGVTYYKMPMNLFGTLSLSGMRMSSADGNGKEIDTPSLARTGWGPAVTASAGKEWWVSPNWGLGGALILNVAALTGQNKKGGAGVAWFGVAGQATYN